ncbi:MULTISPECIES: alpha/beta hydrolase [Trichocoleus]|uniref:Alpha/beta hydrolase n=1 Tax=Trichocoleus desertorum GB2-A4 TaxID=2933944 RepID=A0ABV0J3N7_9CYAN|nr:alpha/beta hydrolase [Trichocoleus sp. FACHB-46]MBD1861746.1 alpha/beta hydrolase [Trichocoleus sp. FACHB-46]
MNFFLSGFVALTLRRWQLQFVSTDHRVVQTHPVKRWTLLGLGALSSGLLLPSLAHPAAAAERVYVSYGSVERSISVDTLETYARTGTINDDLAAYAQYADPKQLQDLREVLLTPIQLSSVAVSQFLYTPQAETLLMRLGQVIQTEARQTGFYAIRSALILAAAQPEGLTLLNVMRQFPTDGIRVNLGRSLEIANALDEFVEQTRQASVAISQQATAEAALAPVTDFSALADLRQTGGFEWEKTTITLSDRTRKTIQRFPNRPPIEVPRERVFPVDIYMPLASAAQNQAQPYPAPVIVISHGLGSDRTTFDYLAKHLASYGFVVALPEHLGSNAGRLQALLSGTATDVAESFEFVDRPLDVKYLLDELERRSKSEPLFQGRLNLQQVGVVGQSFGGYTALSVAGATLNFEQLAENCQRSNESLNLSLLLQCRARELAGRQYELRDPRIKAAIAINPVDSTVFGEPSLSQIQVPLMMIAANADTVAPALPEQIRPFTWLTMPEKYLVLMNGATHFSAIGASATNSEVVPIPTPVIGAAPALAYRYIQALSVAFFKTHITNQEQFRPYLTSAYAANISRAPLKLDLVQSFTAAQLAQALDGETEEPTVPPESVPAPPATSPSEPLPAPVPLEELVPTVP